MHLSKCFLLTRTPCIECKSAMKSLSSAGYIAPRRSVMEVYPKGDASRPLTGVFSTRSPDRPNPIGLYRVKVLGMNRGRLHVGPLEAIDGNPGNRYKISDRFKRLPTSSKRD